MTLEFCISIWTPIYKEKYFNLSCLMHKLGELGENSRSNVRIFYMYLDVYFWAKMFIAYFDNEIED